MCFDTAIHWSSHFTSSSLFRFDALRPREKHASRSVMVDNFSVPPSLSMAISMWWMHIARYDNLDFLKNVARIPCKPHKFFCNFRRKIHFKENNFFRVKAKRYIQCDYTTMRACCTVVLQKDLSLQLFRRPSDERHFLFCPVPLATARNSDRFWFVTICFGENGKRCDYTRAGLVNLSQRIHYAAELSKNDVLVACGDTCTYGNRNISDECNRNDEKEKGKTYAIGIVT